LKNVWKKGGKFDNGEGPRRDGLKSSRTHPKPFIPGGEVSKKEKKKENPSDLVIKDPKPGRRRTKGGGGGSESQLLESTGKKIIPLFSEGSKLI